MDILPKQLEKLMVTLNQDNSLNSWRISHQKNVTIISLKYIAFGDQDGSSQVEHKPAHYVRKSPSTLARDYNRYNAWLGSQTIMQDIAQVDSTHNINNVDEEQGCLQNVSSEEVDTNDMAELPSQVTSASHDGTFSYLDSNLSVISANMCKSAQSTNDSATQHSEHYELCAKENTPDNKPIKSVSEIHTSTLCPDTPPYTPVNTCEISAESAINSHLQDDQFDEDVEEMVEKGAPHWMAKGLTDMLRSMDKTLNKFPLSHKEGKVS